MCSRGMLFCFASAISFKQHENEDCEAKPFHFWILPGNLLSAVYSEKYLFHFFSFSNVCVQASILTLIWWNYNLKKNLKICKITSYFANILNDGPPLSGVGPRIFNGCRICQDICQFIKISLTRAIQVLWMCDSCYHDESASSERFWPYLGKNWWKSVANYEVALSP